MRIAVISSRFPVLSQTFVLNQITALIDAGHEVTIIAGAPEEPGPVHDDVERYGLMERVRYWEARAGEARPGFVARLRHLRRSGIVRTWRVLRRSGFATALIRQERAMKLEALPGFDAILVHFGTLGLECQFLREMGALKGPMATVFHGYDMSIIPRERGEDVYRFVLEGGELLLPISDFWRTRLIEMGADERKIRVHHMGVDPERFVFQARQRAEGEGLKILSVGRFVEKKGFDDGVRAFAAFAARAPGATYRIVGDGELRGEVEALADELGVASKVACTGWAKRDEVQEALKEHHVLFVPSKTGANGDKEGIPVVLMEAMASGMPVVTTYHSGIPELVEDNVSGFLADENDWKGLSEALSKANAADNARLKALGEAGRRRVEEEFSLPELNRDLISILRSISGGATR